MTKGLKIRVEGDSKDLQSDVQKSKKALEDLGRKGKAAGRDMTESFKKAKESVGGLNNSVKVLLASYASIQTARIIKDQFLVAAKNHETAQSFKILAKEAGESSDQILAALRKAADGTVADIDLINSSARASLLGIAFKDQVKLMEIARATSKASGQTVTKAFEDIQLAVGRGSRQILDNLGLVVSIEKANEEYAKTLKKTASELSSTEQKQAFLNATFKAGERFTKILNSRTKSVNTSLQQMGATIKNVLTVAWNDYMGKLQQTFEFFSRKSKVNVIGSIKEIEEEIKTANKRIAGMKSPDMFGETASPEAIKKAERDRDKLKGDLYAQKAALAEIRKEEELLRKVREKGSKSNKTKDDELTPTVISEKSKAVEQARLDEMKKYLANFTTEKDALLKESDKLIEASMQHNTNVVKAETQAYQDELAQRQASLGEFFAMKEGAEMRSKEAERNAREEALKAVQEFHDAWGFYTKDAVDSFAGGMSSAFIEFADGTKTAEKAFKDFARSFLNQIAQMIIKQQILNAIQSTSWGAGLMGAAKGAAFEGGVQKMAKGGIVNKPTLFPMANGAGLMGEKGAEAVMPLGRNSKGELGVKGGGGNTTVVYNIQAIDSQSLAEHIRRNESLYNMPLVNGVNRGDNGVLNALKSGVS